MDEKSFKQFAGKNNTTHLNIAEDKEKIIPVWSMIIFLSYVHFGGLYGLYLAFTSAHILTIVLLVLCHVFGIFGITAGSHRLWAHKTYKAKLPLNIILMVCATLAFQGSIIHWARNHRTHHKHSDTPADPHNINYGFFYSHCGWVMCERSHLVKMERSKIDVSDLYANPVLMFQKKYKHVLAFLVAVVIPTLIPMYFWGETFSNAFWVNTLRYLISLTFTMSINSLAHYFGGRPYNPNIFPRENSFLSSLTLGEGFHNYHHTFPWDYKAAELGNYSLNPTTALIDLFAKIGWAYDLKMVSEEMIRNRCAKLRFDNENAGGRDKKD